MTSPPASAALPGPPTALLQPPLATMTVANGRPLPPPGQSYLQDDGKEKKRFACPDCDYTCALKQCLTSHLRGVHNKGRPLVPCPYEGCAVKRLSKSAIQLHVDSVHLKLKRHFCHLCDYKSCDGNSLNVHLRGVHNLGGKYPCTFDQTCKTKCVTRAALVHHINTKHLKVTNSHTCHICAFTTHSVREYRRHLDAHKRTGQQEEAGQLQTSPTQLPPPTTNQQITSSTYPQLQGGGHPVSKRGRKPKQPTQILTSPNAPTNTPAVSSTNTGQPVNLSQHNVHPPPPVDLNSLQHLAQFQQHLIQQQQSAVPVFLGQMVKQEQNAPSFQGHQIKQESSHQQHQHSVPVFPGQISNFLPPPS